jgi:hypothetical protein
MTNREMTFQDFAQFIDALALQALDRKVLTQVLQACAAVTGNQYSSGPQPTINTVEQLTDYMVREGGGTSLIAMRELWYRYERMRGVA